MMPATAARRMPSQQAKFAEFHFLRASVNGHQTRGMSLYLTCRAYSSYPTRSFFSIRSSRVVLQTSRPRITRERHKPHQEPKRSALPGKNKNMLPYMGCLTYRYGPELTTVWPLSS